MKRKLNNNLILIISMISSMLLIFLNGATGLSVAKCSKNDGQEIILETTTGKLRGSCEFVTAHGINSKEIKSGNVYSWLSVPYAEAPIGENRFKRTVEKAPWSDVLNATKWPNSCIQVDHHSEDSADNVEELFAGFSMWRPNTKYSQQSEDCLYLNIWAPTEAYLNVNFQDIQDPNPQKFPIIVFFHMGSFTSGSSALDVLDPSTFVVATNTIFITVNYRLGVNGFLYLDGVFPGNQALYDQHEALRWIKNNAERFGGDPTKITLAGNSAGAVSVSYHLFIRKSWHLFRNAILQSGTVLIPAFSPIKREEANRRARQLLKLAGCENETELAKCAQSIPNLNKYANRLFYDTIKNNRIIQSFLLTHFGPVLDGELLFEQPDVSLKRGNFKRCPILLGNTANEGSMFLALSGILGHKVAELRKQTNISHSSLVNFLNSYFLYYPKYPNQNNRIFTNLILHEYTKLTSYTEEGNLPTSINKPSYFNELVKIIGDESYVCPAYKFADSYAKHNNNVYLYLFSHRISTSPWPIWYGAVHGDDLAFTFAQPLASKKNHTISVNPWSNPKHIYSNNEKILSNEMITYWSNFAKYNSPNKPNTNKAWPEYTLYKHNYNKNSSNGLTGVETQSGLYIVFKINGTRVNRGYALEQCYFWNSYLPNILQEHVDIVEMKISQLPPTCPPSTCQPSTCPTPTHQVQNPNPVAFKDTSNTNNNNNNNDINNNNSSQTLISTNFKLFNSLLFVIFVIIYTKYIQ